MSPAVAQVPPLPALACRASAGSVLTAVVLAAPALTASVLTPPAPMASVLTAFMPGAFVPRAFVPRASALAASGALAYAAVVPAAREIAVKLYSYFRSSAAYRVRIALNLKGLEHEILPVNLLRAEHRDAAYRQVNPQGLLPALDTGNGAVLSQSLAILEWLEETCPEPALLPAEPLLRAQVRSVVAHIACDVHPILNLAVLQYLKEPLGADQGAVDAWYRHWIARGFRGVESALVESAGRCSFGDEPTLADCCLVPQVYNARRFEVPLQDFPTILRVAGHCEGLPAFAAAHPSRQPDTPA